MNADRYQKGHLSFKPYYLIDGEIGRIIPIELPADAVMREAKPGVKANNPLLDEINEQLRQESLIKKIKELYITYYAQ